jgi:hypothetical protein
VPTAWKYCVLPDVADSITGAASKNDPTTVATITMLAHTFAIALLLDSCWTLQDTKATSAGLASCSLARLDRGFEGHQSASLSRRLLEATVGRSPRATILRNVFGFP